MTSDAQRYFDALKRITAYMEPEQLRKRSLKMYGIEPEEAIEFAYENVLAEAKAAIRGKRRPLVATPPTPLANSGTDGQNRIGDQRGDQQGEACSD